MSIRWRRQQWQWNMSRPNSTVTTCLQWAEGPWPVHFRSAFPGQCRLHLGRCQPGTRRTCASLPRQLTARRQAVHLKHCEDFRQTCRKYVETSSVSTSSVLPSQAVLACVYFHLPLFLLIFHQTWAHRLSHSWFEQLSTVSLVASTVYRLVFLASNQHALMDDRLVFGLYFGFYWFLRSVDILFQLAPCCK